MYVKSHGWSEVKWESSTASAHVPQLLQKRLCARVREPVCGWTFCRKGFFHVCCLVVMMGSWVSPYFWLTQNTGMLEWFKINAWFIRGIAQKCYSAGSLFTEHIHRWRWATRRVPPQAEISDSRGVRLCLLPASPGLHPRSKYSTPAPRHMLIPPLKWVFFWKRNTAGAVIDPHS